MSFFSRITGAEEKLDRINLYKAICDEINLKVDKIQTSATVLFQDRKGYVKAILDIDGILKSIKSLPAWITEEYSETLEQIADFQRVISLENDPKALEKLLENMSGSSKTAAIAGAAGTGVGIATALGGGTAALSLATVFGTASTGTAISALSGVAATNAALAWLGGGALAAGGAGVTGGSLVLSLFGPIGITIAGVSAAGSLFFMRSKNREMVKEIDNKLNEIKKQSDQLSFQIAHLMSILYRSESFYQNKFSQSYLWLVNVTPKDYAVWSDEDKHQLEKLLNYATNMASLIAERI